MTDEQKDMSTVTASENAQADVDAVMKKYDRESNTRIWTGVPGGINCMAWLYCRKNRSSASW